MIERFDVRSGQGSTTIVRSMSGGNQQKAIIAREMTRKHDLLIAVQPTRGLDEVFNLADKILVMFDGKIVGEFKNENINIKELGLYMAGAKQQEEVGNV